jgi:DNA-binding transcriptional MocR family regulator
MSSFRPSGRRGPSQLVLGFGNVAESAIQRGIATVADLL